MSKHRLIAQKLPRMNVGLPYATALATLLLCAFAAVSSARAGLSRLMSEYGEAVNSIAAAERALEFSRFDPQAHYALGHQLLSAGQTDAAVAQFQRAVSLRPADYFLWQELGRAREDSGDVEGAVFALRQAIKLAPSYSQPHWQLGNILLRKDELTEAFGEMRKAATSDPSLFPSMCDLAWGVYDGNVAAIIGATKPQTDDERGSLARLFISHNEIGSVVNLLDACTNIGAEDRRVIVDSLIDAREYQTAYTIWSNSATASSHEVLFDGGFEGPINFDEQGFGWRFMPAQTVRPIIDLNNPHSGKRSLRLDYSGIFNPAGPIVSQLVPVSPRALYSLSFAARTEDLKSAGLPIVLIKNASDAIRVLAQSAALTSGTNPWKEFTVEFETAENTNAITINIQRLACSSNPCPIVGRAWFDSFALAKR